MTESVVVAKPRVHTANFLRAIRLELGSDRGYGVKVELSDGQIVHALREAINEYSRYHPQKTYQTFDTSVGTFEYTPDPAIRGILKIDLVRNTQLGLALPELTFIGGRILGHGGVLNYKIPYEYAVFQEWRRGAEQIFSQEPVYEFVPSANKLYVYSPACPVRVYLVGAIDLDPGFDEELLEDVPEELDDTEPGPVVTERLDATLGLIPARHLIWIRKLTQARSMQILGRMRSKYGSIPTVEGKDMQLDGDAMKVEGKGLWDETIEQMRTASLGELGPLFA